MSVVSTPHRRKLTADQFDRMGETGILGPDARVEWIEGDLMAGVVAPVTLPAAALRVGAVFA
jgi:hypothetical protein